ncbi:TrlF family AAA-like ATPase [Bacillus wiedmannii]|uniref:TrlF family AAA-like ATPase n=1 Tax=Bacillus wiedmannii TaxID=1890302 RepID=UPI003D22A751
MEIIHGTIWHKCDLHLHTPASSCFRDKNLSEQEWVQKAIDEGLSCVAVTDHNSGNWINNVITAANGTNLTVFPGVEITCSDAKIHMLILFDTDKNSTDIEDFLIQSGIPRHDFGKETAHTSKSLEDIIKLAKSCEALVIPAHIDEFNGISNASYQIREKIFNTKDINAVQVVHPEFLNPALTQDEKKSLRDKLMLHYDADISEAEIKKYLSTVQQAIKSGKAILTFSDNPHAPGDSKHGIAGIGSRFTWIKMEQRPNLESLRQAFLLKDLRVKADFDSFYTPYNFPDTWLESVSIYNSEITGREKVQYNFSPQMTTIIGGRGTGKSNVIKILRGIFGKDKDLKQFNSLLMEHSEFFQLKNNRNKSGVLKADTKIEAVFIRNKIRYKVTASNFSENSKNVILTRRHNLDVKKWDEGTQKYQSMPNAEDFIELLDFDVFSQRQIFEIAQTPNALRDMIDNSITDLDKLKKKCEKIRSEYCEASVTIRRLQTLIKDKGKLNISLTDIMEQISSYQKSGVTELIQRKEKFDSNVANVFKVITESLKEKEELLQKITDEFLITQYSTAELDDIYQEETDNIISDVYSELIEIKDDLDKAKVRMINLNKYSRDKFKSSSWAKDFRTTNTEFEEKKNELKEIGILDLENIEKLIQKREEILKELSEISNHEIMLEKLKIIKEELKKEFLNLRREITQKRKEFLRNVIDVDFVKIEVVPFRDLQHYELEFRNIINKDDNFVSEIEMIIEKIFYKGNVEIQVPKVIKEIQDIQQTIADGDYGIRFRNMVRRLSDDQIDKLEILMPEDEIKVSYKQNDSAKWKPLSNASAGQKTSAILAFILSHGSIPLILDQPEDDMDNYVIYELIVKKISDTKNKRQVIIATHNANIPVNGDSEYIIVMNSESKLIKVLREGTVENKEVKNDICAIMEGGEKAFQMRSQRYHL